jgi:hypothetical protein
MHCSEGLTSNAASGPSSVSSTGMREVSELGNFASASSLPGARASSGREKGGSTPAAKAVALASTAALATLVRTSRRSSLATSGARSRRSDAQERAQAVVSRPAMIKLSTISMSSSSERTSPVCWLASRNRDTKSGPVNPRTPCTLPSLATSDCSRLLPRTMPRAKARMMATSRRMAASSGVRSSLLSPNLGSRGQGCDAATI